ncbi:hypothetical protein B7435_16230 [Mycolicibacterium peregrinum]|uniref:Uncharacterized protein n=1 Tax=Mycolicibacterium peregrinum TaxID=43304 RepID=A0A246BXQ8_MYCPR|nr:hypothetical protein [Mycolicibacterium peregrinum]OWM01885.1 hypothetical protein B7435_16230 [Mycolicibacterium peregrinum]TGB45131.1 hypothetical protein EJD98_06565 [Mycolicibacterium peregrinum]TGB46392.1 hypothetical protein EJD94_05385 [Mycolicibacterium peregrinum]
MRWEWWLLGALVCALAGWLLRRYGPDVPGVHLAARVLTIGGLSVVAAVTALYVGFFALLLYWPVVRVFDDGWPLTFAVYAQAAVMFGVVVIAVWPNVLSRLPVLVFAATTLAFSAWLCLHPLEWLPQPS